MPTCPALRNQHSDSVERFDGSLPSLGQSRDPLSHVGAIGAAWKRADFQAEISPPEGRREEMLSCFL